MYSPGLTPREIAPTVPGFALHAPEQLGTTANVSGVPLNVAPSASFRLSVTVTGVTPSAVTALGVAEICEVAGLALEDRSVMTNGCARNLPPS